jgi:hypothetical protein
MDSPTPLRPAGSSGFRIRQRYMTSCNTMTSCTTIAVCTMCYGPEVPQWVHTHGCHRLFSHISNNLSFVLIVVKEEEAMLGASLLILHVQWWKPSVAGQHNWLDAFPETRRPRETNGMFLSSCLHAFLHCCVWCTQSVWLNVSKRGCLMFSRYS